MLNNTENKSVLNPFDDSDDERNIDHDDPDGLYPQDSPPPSLGPITLVEEPRNLVSASFLPLSPFSSLGDGDECIDYSDDGYDSDSDLDSDDDDFNHLYSHDGPPNSTASNRELNSSSEYEISKPEGKKISSIIEFGMPTPPPTPKQHHTKHPSKMSPTAVDDDEEYFRPTIVQGPYSRIATNAFEEKILYTIIDLDSHAEYALNLLHCGYPPEAIPNRLSKCCWAVKTFADNRKLLDDAALSSPIPLIRLTTPNGALCQLEEKMQELPWDFEAYVDERDEMQAIMGQRRNSWFEKRRQTEIEQLNERVRELIVEIEKERQDEMRVYRLPQLEDITEEEQDGDGGDGNESAVRCGWMVEGIRWARRLVLKRMKGTINEDSADYVSDESAVYWSSDESDFDSAVETGEED